MLPVWFFIGALLLAYGVIILATALAEWSHPPPAVLAEKRPELCEGLLLILLGGFYTYRFRPGRERD
jgi:hypothetical protein